MQKREELLIAVFILSLGAYIWHRLFGEKISLKDFVFLLPQVIPLFGAAREKKRRGRRRAKPFRLTPSFESGLYGGLIGGALAGLIIGVVYYVDCLYPDRLKYGAGIESGGWEIIPYIFMYASLAGTVLGASSQLIILWFRHLVTERQYSSLLFNEVSGGILGSAMPGIPVGALGGWLFGLRPIPFPEYGLLVPSSVLGAICIALGALLYDYEGRWGNVMRALLASGVISAFAAMLGIVVLQRLKIDIRFFPWEATALQVTEGGAILGLVIGILLGLQVGCTLRLYRLWEVTTEPTGH